MQVPAYLFVAFLFGWETFVPSLTLWKSKLLHSYILTWFNRLLNMCGHRVGGIRGGGNNQRKVVIQPRNTSQPMQSIPGKLIKKRRRKMCWSSGRRWSIYNLGVQEARIKQFKNNNFSIIFYYHVCFLVARKMYSESSIKVNNQSYIDERPTNTHQFVQQNEGKQAAKQNHFIAFSFFLGLIIYVLVDFCFLL